MRAVVAHVVAVAGLDRLERLVQQQFSGANRRQLTGLAGGVIIDTDGAGRGFLPAPGTVSAITSGSLTTPSLSTMAVAR